jgi:polyhydroxyalkanoate synthase
MSWKDELKFSKQLLQKIADQSHEEINFLNSGLQIYSKAFIKKHELTGQKVCTFGNSTLYEYSANNNFNNKPVILVVPSLVNKANILDLSPEKSFMQNLKTLGYKTFLLDWGKIGDIEKSYSLSDYIKRLNQVIIFLNKLTEQKTNLIGYCMGGFMSVAAAAIDSQNTINDLVLLACPWDFNLPIYKSLKFLNINFLPNDINAIPGSFLQSLFYCNNAFAVNKKFINLARGLYNLEEFAQVENWVNDCVDIPINTFKEFINQLVIENGLANATWNINNYKIAASKINNKTLILTGLKDTVVPTDSTHTLLNQLKNLEHHEFDTGHLGLVLSNKFPIIQIIKNFLLN